MPPGVPERPPGWLAAGLPPGQGVLADLALAFVAVIDHRRGHPVPAGAFDHTRPAVVTDRDGAVGGAEIYAKHKVVHGCPPPSLLASPP